MAKRSLLADAGLARHRCTQLHRGGSGHLLERPTALQVESQSQNKRKKLSIYRSWTDEIGETNFIDPAPHPHCEGANGSRFVFSRGNASNNQEAIWHGSDSRSFPADWFTQTALVSFTACCGASWSAAARRRDTKSWRRSTSWASWPIGWIARSRPRCPCSCSRPWRISSANCLREWSSRCLSAPAGASDRFVDSGLDGSTTAAEKVVSNRFSCVIERPPAGEPMGSAGDRNNRSAHHIRHCSKPRDTFGPTASALSFRPPLYRNRREITSQRFLPTEGAPGSETLASFRSCTTCDRYPTKDRQNSRKKGTRSCLVAYTIRRTSVRHRGGIRCILWSSSACSRYSCSFDRCIVRIRKHANGTLITWRSLTWKNWYQRSWSATWLNRVGTRPPVACFIRDRRQKVCSCCRKFIGLICSKNAVRDIPGFPPAWITPSSSQVMIVRLVNHWTSLISPKTAPSVKSERGIKKSSELIQPSTSPVARSKPLLTAWYCPSSGSDTQ